MLRIKENYTKNLENYKNLSNIVISNINFNYMYCEHINSIMILEKIKIFSKIDLPQELIDLIIIKLF